MPPNDLGKFLSLEDFQDIKIGEVMKAIRREIKQVVIESAIQAVGIPISLTSSKTGFGGSRYWFVCPACSRRVGVLYRHEQIEEMCCRKCLGCHYRKQRYKGMIGYGTRLLEAVKRVENVPTKR
jgi:hypothetical protein